jgi:CheY-like chemotaxis protein
MNRQVRKILCALQDPATAKLARFLFEEQGYSVLMVETAAEALVTLRRDAPDVYLLEARWLGDQQGAELFREIRDFDPAAPVVLCSADAFPAAAHDVSAAGAHGCVCLTSFDSDTVNHVERSIGASDARSVAALVEETRTMAENIASVIHQNKQLMLQVESQLNSALEELLKANAKIRFIRDGGTQANFARLWARALREANEVAQST